MPLEFLRRCFGLRRKPPAIDEALWRQVEARLPFLAYLTQPQRLRLRELASGFLASKQFHGAGGLELTDEMMLAIALQACLPILRIGLDAYRGWVGIVVYPGGILIPRQEMDEHGVVHEFEDEVLGEAWEDGPVLLSWDEEASLDAERGPGLNVVIHEFAHKLDMSNGGADGLPPLPPDISRRAWAEDFSAAYESLCQTLELGLPTMLDPYAAEHPAEFFAVSAEAFFETPAELQAAHPKVYAHLSRLFGCDPARGSLSRPSTSG